MQGSSTPRINIFIIINYFLQKKLMQQPILNPRNYSKQELIMIIFVQATDHNINMHAKIQYLILHRFL